MPQQSITAVRNLKMIVNIRLILNSNFLTKPAPMCKEYSVIKHHHKRLKVSMKHIFFEHRSSYKFMKATYIDLRTGQLTSSGKEAKEEMYAVSHEATSTFILHQHIHEIVYFCPIQKPMLRVLPVRGKDSLPTIGIGSVTRLVNWGILINLFLPFENT